jgi:hypothetical protein
VEITLEELHEIAAKLREVGRSAAARNLLALVAANKRRPTDPTKVFVPSGVENALAHAISSAPVRNRSVR